MTNNNYFRVVGHHRPSQYVFFDGRSPLSTSAAHERALDLRGPVRVESDGLIVRESIVVYELPRVPGPWQACGVVGVSAP